ncbi:MAG: metal-dependent hydrolase [Myxococcota bacterium]
MNPVTHLLVGWTLAEAADLPRRDRALVTLAAVAPDLDGLGLLLDVAGGVQPSVGAYGAYHHVLAHNLAAALVCAVLAFAVARQRALCAGLVFVSFHLHLLGDLVGSAGPARSIWSLAYLYPFSDRLFAWQGQWELNAWPNVLVTVVLLAWTGVLAVRRGRSPLELVSKRADAAVVTALRGRFAT